jgi:hypothetical protein
MYTIKNLKNKLTSNNIILVQADKGRTIVVVDNSVYVEKVNNFLITNQFSTLLRDPTDKYQKKLQKILQQSNKVIEKQKIKYLLQNKPRPPTLNAQLQLHKPNIPIRPIVNHINAPTYKVAKFLTKILNEHLNLNNQCYVCYVLRNIFLRYVAYSEIRGQHSEALLWNKVSWNAREIETPGRGKLCMW